MIKPLSTVSAPTAVGAYSQGTLYTQETASALLYTSGQLPLDPATKSMPDNIRDQARQALKNIEAILHAGGSSLKNVLDDFSAVNEIYSSFFTEPYPARSCIAVVALPLGAHIEIEAVAITYG